MIGDAGVSRHDADALPISRPRALALLGGVYLGYAAALRRLPATPVCLFRALTGRRCPLCGLTRGVNRTLAGDFEAARRAHPCAPLATVLLAVGGAVSLTPPGWRSI